MRMMNAAAAFAVIAALIAPAKAQEINCLTYVSYYLQANSTRSATGREPFITVPDAIADEVLDRISNMNRPNALDSVACECKLNPGQDIHQALDRLVKADNAGLRMYTPVGGTAGPRERAWRNKFLAWMAGRGPRPADGGKMACELF